MYYKIFAILCMIIFYLIYIYKLISLNKQSIKTNQVGKGNIFGEYLKKKHH